MIAVVCAVPSERRALAPLAGAGVALHMSGMGAAAAERTGEAVARLRPRALIAAGFCGALSPDLEVGDLVGATEVVDRDTGRRYRPDASLEEHLPGRAAVLVSVPRLVLDPQERAELDGGAVDMESAALARSAAAAGIPFAAVRAVTDAAHHRMPDLQPFLDGRGRLRAGACTAHLIRHPREIPSLVRLAPAARRAGRSLRAGVGHLLEAIA